MLTPTHPRAISGLILALATATAPAQTTAQTAPPAYTLRTRVPITILDLVVTDAKGAPFHDLTASDFTIREDGKQIKPKSFEEFRSDEVQAAPFHPAETLPVNTFSNRAVVPIASAGTGPINLLLLDTLNNTTADQAIVRRQMLAYLDRMPPGTRMAVMGLGSRLTILQGFTSDTHLLKAAVAGRNTVQVSSGEEPQRFLSIPAQEAQSNVVASRAQNTMFALNQVARYSPVCPDARTSCGLRSPFPSSLPRSRLPPPPTSMQCPSTI